MKNKITALCSTLVLITICGLILFFQSCTKDFEEINTDPYGLTDAQLATDYRAVGEPFKQVLQNIYTYSPAWVTQLQQNLIGDVYSGYMMPPTPFVSNVNNMNYALVDGWNGTPWSIAYGNVMSPLALSVAAAGDGFPEFKAWAKICQVEGMHRVSDIYGPIIYTKFGQLTSDGGTEYDCQETAYNAFFADLEAGISGLTALKNAGATEKIASYDLVYGGSYESWIKFGNSLRLRLAIRVSKVNPTLAKTQAEAALSHPMGLIETNELNFVVSSPNGDTHPLNVMDNAWNDIRMGAPMESILGGLNDPRMSKYFEPSLINPGVITGIRQGIDIAAKSDYEGFSSLVDLGDVTLMTAAEVYFLRAEAALRGYANAGGTAQDLYEMGIQKSFEQHKIVGAAAYIADATSSPMDYVDVFNSANNISAVSTVTIAWDDAANFETKLEKIITQKWIAMYPDGQEAWSEFRRTGYPKLFPVVINNSGGKISTTDFIKRINFASNEFINNETEVNKAIQCLGGPDNGGTALWWDVD